MAGDRATQIAAALLSAFGSLADILSAPPERLAQTLAGETVISAYLGLIGQTLLHLLRAEALRGPEIRTGDELLNYLFADMARKTFEEFRVLFLDGRRALIADEVANRGSLSEVSVHTREIVKRALDLGAQRLILIHNHPSGDPHPSEADLRMTRELEQACRWFDMIVDDHLIIGRTGAVSLRRRGLL